MLQVAFLVELWCIKGACIFECSQLATKNAILATISFEMTLELFFFYELAVFLKKN